MTFLDFWNDHEGVTEIWLVTVGTPGGITLRHDTEADDDDWCDLSEWVSENSWVNELSGEIVEGAWAWDGNGNPTYLTNSLLNLKARAAMR